MAYGKASAMLMRLIWAMVAFVGGSGAAGVGLATVAKINLSLLAN